MPSRTVRFDTLPFSNISDKSPLLYAVAHIVASSPEKQVLGVYAWRVVATMADAKPFRDRAIEVFPNDPMNERVPMH